MKKSPLQFENANTRINNALVEFRPTVTKNPHSRSLFVALKMLYLHKYKSNFKTFHEKLKCMKCPRTFPGVQSHVKNKRIRSQVPVLEAALIALLFHSFEVALGLHPRDLTFSQTNKNRTYSTHFGGSTVASEVNAQRNKTSPQGKNASGLHHF